MVYKEKTMKVIDVVRQQHKALQEFQDLIVQEAIERSH
jgi:hypothetical protein